MNLKSACVLLLASFLFLGCKSLSSQSTPMGNVSGELPYETVRWPQKTAAICWEPAGLDQTFPDGAPHQAGATLGDQSPVLQWEGWIVAEYNQRTDFKFKMAGRICSETDRGIRILLADQERRQVYRFGAQLDGLKNGVEINPTFVNGSWSSTCRDGKTRDLCLKDDLLHELGHAIGLRHEASRNDSPCSLDQGVAEPYAVAIGSYDPDSIMNYCANVRNKAFSGEATLSLGDVETINRYYDEAFNSVVQDATAQCRLDGGAWRGILGCCDFSQGGEPPAIGDYPYATCNEAFLISFPEILPTLTQSFDQEDQEEILSSSFELSVSCALDGALATSLVSQNLAAIRDLSLGQISFDFVEAKRIECGRVQLALNRGLHRFYIDLAENLILEPGKLNVVQGDWKLVEEGVKVPASETDLFGTSLKFSLPPLSHEDDQTKFELTCQSQHDGTKVRVLGFPALDEQSGEPSQSEALIVFSTSFRFQQMQYACDDLTARVTGQNGMVRFYSIPKDLEFRHDGLDKSFDFSAGAWISP